MEQKIKEIMADVLEVSIDEITEDASAHSIATWDSLRHLNLILALEKAYGIRFEDAEIPAMINYKMIVATVMAYQE